MKDSLTMFKGRVSSMKRQNNWVKIQCYYTIPQKDGNANAKPTYINFFVQIWDKDNVVPMIPEKALLMGQGKSEPFAIVDKQSGDLKAFNCYTVYWSDIVVEPPEFRNNVMPKSYDADQSFGKADYSQSSDFEDINVDF